MKMKWTKVLKEVAFFGVIILVAGVFSGYIDITPYKSVQGAGNVTTVEITQDQFAELIFDFNHHKEWKYKGDKPVVIDFYASWCGPCKQLRPRLEQLAREYGHEIIVYTIDAELAPQLSAYMGVDQFPTVFFIPMEGKPYKSVGLLPLHKLRGGVEKILKKN